MTILKSRLACVFLSFVLFISLVVAAPPANLQVQLNALVQSAQQEQALKHARIGVYIASLDDGECWYAKNAGELFIPASTTKFVTAALSLASLSPQYQFATRVFTDSRIDDIHDGVLTGDVILQGGGDPLLQPQDLQLLAEQLARGNPLLGIPPIRQIIGQLRADDTFFPRSGPLIGHGWETGDLPWYYAAPASALSCSRNAVTIQAQGTRDGAPAILTITPANKFFSLVHKVNTRANVANGSLAVTVNGTRVTVSGRVAPGVTISERISIPDPARFTLEQFQLALLQAGIVITVPARTPTRQHDNTRMLLAEVYSLPLQTIIISMLKPSDNMIAEQLFWTIQAQQGQDVALSHRYNQILSTEMKEWGAPQNSLRLVDGSGLSRKNQMTPEGLAGVLLAMAASPHYQILRQALPVAGVDGTLRTRMQGTAAENNAYAKTGTMRGVCGLAGYITTRNGESLAYVIFVNGYSSGAASARALQDAISCLLASV